MKACIQCGAELQDDDVFCTNCGTRQPDPELESQQPDQDTQSQQPANSEVCPNCGQPVEENMQFCISCGAKLHSGTDGSALVGGTSAATAPIAVVSPVTTAPNDRSAEVPQPVQPIQQPPVQPLPVQPPAQFAAPSVPSDAAYAGASPVPPAVQGEEGGFLEEEDKPKRGLKTHCIMGQLQCGQRRFEHLNNKRLVIDTNYRNISTNLNSTQHRFIQYIGQFRIPYHRKRHCEACGKYEHLLGGGIIMDTSTKTVGTNKHDIPWNKPVKQKLKPGDRIVDLVIKMLILFAVVAVLYPLWFVIIASFSNPNSVSGGEVTLLPKGINLIGYAKVFSNPRIWQGYINTIMYSVVGTAVNMAVTIPCAFALSRVEFKPRRIIMFLFTVTMFISGGLIPNYLLYKSLGINNSMWVFILPGAVSVYNVIVARSFFETSIPEELHDAAQIDGLSYFGYFFKIVLPLSSAILAVIGLYYFVGHWNDFMTGLIYITDDKKQPLQVVLQQLLLVAQGTGTNVNAAAQQQAADQIKFGIIIVSTLPLLVLYPFLQKYFNKGVMLGAVKG